MRAPSARYSTMQVTIGDLAVTRGPTKDERAARVRFGKKWAKVPLKKLPQEVGLCLDGVIISMPPTDEVGRENHCWGGESSVWRKANEAALPELNGEALPPLPP